MNILILGTLLFSTSSPARVPPPPLFNHRAFIQNVCATAPTIKAIEPNAFRHSYEAPDISTAGLKKALSLGKAPELIDFYSPEEKELFETNIRPAGMPAGTAREAFAKFANGLRDRYESAKNLCVDKALIKRLDLAWFCERDFADRAAETLTFQTNQARYYDFPGMRYGLLGLAVAGYKKGHKPRGQDGGAESFRYEHGGIFLYSVNKATGALKRIPGLAKGGEFVSLPNGNFNSYPSQRQDREMAGTILSGDFIPDPRNPDAVIAATNGWSPIKIYEDTDAFKLGGIGERWQAGATITVPMAPFKFHDRSVKLNLATATWEDAEQRPYRWEENFKEGGVVAGPYLHFLDLGRTCGQ